MLKEKNVQLSGKFLTVVLVIFLLTAVSFAQDKKEDKLNKVKGNVEKITIQTDEGTVTFEGKDARVLFKKMKAGAMHKIRIFSPGDDSDENVFFISPDKMDKDFSFFGNEIKDGKKIEIKIENKNGEKELTVTTTGKDGKSTTETYRGKEAEQYLKKHGHKNFDLKWMGKDGKKGNLFFFRKGDDSLGIDAHIRRWIPADSADRIIMFEDGDDTGINKTIKVTDEDGTKTVTVKTTDENGKVKTETYKGKEAEEYLDKNDIRVKVKAGKDKTEKVKEIIIRKKEKEEKDK